MNIIIHYLNELLGIAITGIVGFAYKQYKAKIHIGIKQEYVKVAVRLVNQLYNDLKPEEKMDKAYAFVSNMLGKHKIKATPDEIKSFIESEVNVVKGDFKTDVAKVEAPKVEQPTQQVIDAQPVITEAQPQTLETK